jgi:hypothetical protein
VVTSRRALSKRVAGISPPASAPRRQSPSDAPGSRRPPRAPAS